MLLCSQNDDLGHEFPHIKGSIGDPYPIFCSLFTLAFQTNQSVPLYQIGLHLIFIGIHQEQERRVELLAFHFERAHGFMHGSPGRQGEAMLFQDYTVQLVAWQCPWNPENLECGGFSFFPEKVLIYVT